MSEVGNYHLELFCGDPNPACPQLGWVKFVAPDADAARAKAREDGWTTPLNIQTSGSYGSPVWACPECSKAEAP